MSYYLVDPVNLFYYNEIKRPDSIERDVDHFWLNMLPDYFKKSLMFGVELEHRVLAGIVEDRADITIRLVRNGSLKKVVLMEDNRRAHESSETKWADAFEQLTRYMAFVRNDSGQSIDDRLYGVVNIGTHTKFYQVNGGKFHCIDYPGTNGKKFELQEDEEEVHNILTELAEKTRA